MPSILFRDALLVDGLADAARPATDVLVAEGRVTAIDRGLPVPEDNSGDVRVIDLGGRTLMPGLIDAHVHPSAAEVSEHPTRPILPSVRTLHARLELEAMLRRGFTTARDAGGADAGLRMATEQGLIDGPRLLVSGQALSQTGGHGDDRTLGGADPGPGAHNSHWARIADGADDVRLAVRHELRKGADQIKVCASGGVMSLTDPVEMTQYSEAELRAAVEEAASRGTYVLAHAYGADAIMRAVTCGIRSIEHGNLIDARAADLVARHGAWVVPTMITYRALGDDGAARGVEATVLAKNARVLEAGLDAFAILREAGVRVGFGSDLLGEHRALQALEFALRAEAERAADIVRSATSVNADLIGRPDLGRVVVGAVADLIVVDGNPLEDVRVLADPAANLRMVVTGGEIRVER